MNLGAVILAGGQSKRMVRDKALLEVGGRPLLVRHRNDLLLMLLMSHSRPRITTTLESTIAASKTKCIKR